MRAYPNNVLGGDTDMLSQLRAGAIELFTLSGGILSTLLPVTSIYNTALSWIASAQRHGQALGRR